MKIIVADNYIHLSEIAANIMADVIRDKPDAVLGLATGSSPIGAYKKLVDVYSNAHLSFSKVRTYNLDEYIGLDASHVQSYHYFMRSKLFDLVDLKAENTHVPSGVGDDLTKNCREYDEMLSSCPRDIQLLGIGSNGHIGFNEPGTPFDSRTHIVSLTEKTKKDNSRLFAADEKVPDRAITMGIKDIMSAKKILLIAYGANKADAIYNTVCGKVTENCPASVLQKHKDVTLVLDTEAASKLDKSIIEK